MLLLPGSYRKVHGTSEHCELSKPGRCDYFAAEFEQALPQDEVVCCALACVLVVVSRMCLLDFCLPGRKNQTTSRTLAAEYDKDIDSFKKETRT